MVIFYKNYPFSPLATLISALANVVGLFAAIGAIFLITLVRSNAAILIPAVLLAALAVFLIVYVGRKMTDKLSEKWSDQNIRTKPRFAYQYCMQHPEAYQQLAEINPEFGAKYMINEKGKIAKRK